MKKTMLTVVLMGVLAVGPAMQASAINREWSAVLGFLGGYMVANGGLCSRTVYQEPLCVERPVYHETIIVEKPVIAGHYELCERRIWEPGFWEVLVTRCGREQRIWHDGCYRTEMVQVWVDDGPPRHGPEHREPHRR